MPKILTNLDLGKNELQNVVIQKLNSAPSNPIEGQIYYNTLSKNLYRYNGTNWVTYQADLNISGTTSVNTLSIDNTPTASSPNLVTSGGVYAAIQGGSGSTVYTNSTTIDSVWIQVDPDAPYEHSVFLDNYTVTANTKVDIQPSAAVITQLIADGVKALYIANNSGSLTAYAIDAAPSTSITLQVTCTEVTSA